MVLCVVIKHKAQGNKKVPAGTAIPTGATHTKVVHGLRAKLLYHLSPLYERWSLWDGIKKELMELIVSCDI